MEFVLGAFGLLMGGVLLVRGNAGSGYAEREAYAAPRMRLPALAMIVGGVTLIGAGLLG